MAIVVNALFAFATRPRISQHTIQVSVDNGFVALRGKVPTYYDRQLIAAVTRHVAGVFGIDNWLTVAEADEQVAPATAFSAIAPLPETIPTHRAIIGGRRIRRVLRAGLAVLSLAALWFTGCGKEDTSRVPVHPVSGAISFRGQPTSGAFLSLHPKDGASTGAPSPRATVGPDGKFALSTYNSQDGAPEGDYVVTVQW